MSRSPAREYAATLGLGAAGAALVLLSVRQGWAHVTTMAVAPLPAGAVSVSGQDLVPVAGALGLVSLAGLAAVVATRRLARRLVGALLTVSGAVTVAMVSVHLTTAEVLAAAHGAALSQAGSVTSGGASGVSPGAAPGGALPGVSAAGQVAMAGFPWRGLAALGALAVLAVGVAVMWRGAQWPAMSSRYDRAGGPPGEQPLPGTDPASLWESLSRGMDPTEPRHPPGRG